jgi:aminopeptidase N
VEVYYHAGHDRNVERMMRAAIDTLDYMQETLGPYPFRQLKIVEIPSYWKFGGHARADTISIVDVRGFLTDASDPDRIDLVYRRTAHEVAHQWWGHRLSPATAAGASMIVESLTKYSELMVMRRAFGEGMVRDALVLELDRYLSGRADALSPEPPLDRVDDEDHIYYGKGALVLHAIAELIGEEATSRALRNFYEAESGAGRAPKASELVASLRAETPDSLRPLVEQWTSEVVLYDVGVESATATKRSDGRWDVALRVRAAKTKVADDGSESPIAMDEPVTVALYADENEEKLLVASKHAVGAGESVIRIVVDAEPRAVVLDPAMCLIDRNRFDNARRVGGGERR